MRIPIWYFLEANGYGGCENHLLQVVETLDAADFDARLIVQYRDADEAANRVLMEKVNDLVRRGRFGAVEMLETKRSALKALADVSAMSRLRALLKRNKGIVHFYKSSIGRCSAASLSIRSLGLPSVQTLQLPPNIVGHLPWHIRIRHKLYLSLTHSVITVSEASRSYLCRFYDVPGQRVVAIPNGIRLREFSESAPTAKDARAIVREQLGIDFARSTCLLIIARLDPDKGHVYLIEAAEILRNEEPELYSRLVILCAGGGPLLDRLDAAIHEKGLNGSVRMLGFRSDIGILLSASDAVVLPSLHEGLPLSLVEAMALGKPIVATRIPGTTEAVVDGMNGILVEPGDARSLADGISRMLLLSEEKRTEMGLSGKRLAAERFDLERQVVQLTDLYRNLWKGAAS